MSWMLYFTVCSVQHLWVFHPFEATTGTSVACIVKCLIIQSFYTEIFFFLTCYLYMVILADLHWRNVQRTKPKHVGTGRAGLPNPFKSTGAWEHILHTLGWAAYCLYLMPAMRMDVIPQTTSKCQPVHLVWGLWWAHWHTSKRHHDLCSWCLTVLTNGRKRTLWCLMHFGISRRQ